MDLVPFTSQAYGHIVHWILYIDTEKLNGLVATDVTVTASATDRGIPANDGVTYTSNTASVTGGTTISGAVTKSGTAPDITLSQGDLTGNYRIDVVPYIQGIKTALSKKSKKTDTSEYDRTALGHYPVASTETIYLYGFNIAGGTLSDSATPTANTLSLGAADTTTYEGFTVYPTWDTTNNKKADVSAFTSGALTVKVGTAQVDSLNNKNWNNSKGTYGATVPAPSAYGNSQTLTTFSNFYNRKPNQQNNYSLTDDIVLDVWKFNDRAAKPAASGAIFDPIMKINPKQTGDGAGVIGFAYVSGTRRFSMANDNNSYQVWVGDYDNLSATGFAYDSAGNTYGTALGGDIGGNFSNSKYAFMTSLWGPSVLSDHGTKIYNWQTGKEEPRAKHQRVEQIGQTGTKANTTDTTNYIDKNRVQSPSIAVSGTGTNATVYLAYYDHLNQEIRFRWASKPKNDTGDNRTRGFDGTSYINDNYTQPRLGQNGNKDKYNTIDFQIIAESGVTNSTALGNAGPYVSIDVIPNAGGTEGAKYDIVVIAWYDKENKNLMYTYNKTDLSAVTKANFEGSANTKTHWQTAKPIFSNAGMYCQIKVAPDGSIHFAGYDGDSGDIRYAKLAEYSNTSVDSCIVDSNGIVGSNLTLDVAKDESGNVVPYIGYYGSSGPKMAYLSDLGKAQSSVVAGAVNDMFTGYWEVTEIPTQSNAVKDRINVGVWKDADGVIKASTTGTNSHADETGNTSTDGSVYGNGTAYPVLGYEIRPSTDTGFMETAQMQ